MHWELHTNTGSAQPLADIPTSLLYGYNAYTTLKMPISEQQLDLHLQRLKKDCKALGLAWRFVDHQVMSQLKALFRTETPVVRLTVLADVDGYGNFFSHPQEALPTRLLVSCRSLPTWTSSGLRLKAICHQRPLPTVKHGAMTETLLRQRQAKANGYDDILLCLEDGSNPLVLEASTSNIWGIRNGELRTPEPNRDGCLPGITRQLLMEAAQRLQIPVNTAPLRLEELQACQGVFLSNAVSGLRQVVGIDTLAITWTTAAQRLMESLAHSVNT